MGKTILVIPDTQFPFHHQDCFDFLRTIKSKYNPNEVIHLGDEVDFHALGRWTKNPDGYSAGHELEQAIYCMKQLYGIFPNVKVCTSNHTVRPLKAAFEAGIPRKFLRDYHEFLEAPKGWVWKDRWYVDKIIFEHGENVSGKYAGLSAATQNMQSTVIGHIHSYAGIQYIACHDRLIFGFNVGCLIDHHKYAFAYSKKARIKPTLGCGIIQNGIPHFIPMKLNGRNKWIRK